MDTRQSRKRCNGPSDSRADSASKPRPSDMTTAAKVAVIKANPAPGFSEWHPALREMCRAEMHNCRIALRSCLERMP